MRTQSIRPTARQRAVLAVIASRKGQPIKLKEIAAELSISQSSAGGRVRKLQEKGLLSRRCLEITQ